MKCLLTSALPFLVIYAVGDWQHDSREEAQGNQRP